jgi:Icc-related predicted phosphoesterase
VLADACRGVSIPIFAVLGNHDLHCGLGDEVRATVEDAGVHVLDRSSGVCELDGLSVGVVGTKGFVGGFPGSTLPDFGEPLLRQVYSETTEEVDALAAGLEAVTGSDYRIVLLHYSPTATTLEGEPRGIWAFLGSDRLAEPIAEHRPDVVLHGHTHAGTFEGSVGSVPVFNVALPVLGRDFFVFELDGENVRTAA